jgi:hypothetical protein
MADLVDRVARKKRAAEIEAAAMVAGPSIVAGVVPWLMTG